MRILPSTLVLLLVSVLRARASTFVVDRTGDSASATTCSAAPEDCSLRGAIIAANMHGGADQVDVPAGTYTLTLAGRGEDAAATGDLDVTDDLTIVGAGNATTIIDANGIDRVFHTDPLGTGVDVTISGLTIKGGSSTVISFILSDGGGIRNGNSSPGHDNVGGTLHVEDCVITANTTERDGGGIANAGALELVDTIVSGNTAGSNGGGVSQEDNGSTTISISTLSGNTAGQGGGYFSGYFSIGASPVVQIDKSTISGNMATIIGGLFYNRGTLTLTNTTISGNQGAGVYAPGGASTINNCTIAGNGGTGLDGAIMITIANSILAGNVGADCGSTINSAGHNLIQNVGCTITGDTTGNVTGQDPQLGALMDNGGATPTRALAPTSPAVDAGSPATPGSGSGACMATDQRGTTRPQPIGGVCDIGAFELVPVATTTTTSSTTSSSTSTSSPTPTTTSSSTSSSTSTSTTTAPASSSTSTSSSLAPPTTVHATSTTTTTVPSGPCDGVPAAATFASISCRLTALRAHVDGEPGLGAFQAKLAKSVAKGAGKIDEAVTSCGGSDAKKTKKRLQQGGTALTQLVHRLKGHAARKQLGALADSFVAEAQPIADDVKALRRVVQCPADAR